MAGAGFKIDKLDYEKVGRMESTLMGRLKGKTRLRVLAKLLGVAQAAFAEDLIAVARK
jgi:small neutral amino acid transporter SnatA (MarC family)